VKYTDFDMKMMAWGEVAAQLIAILAAVAIWVYMGELSAFVKVPVALVVLLAVAKISLDFVHIGYDPEKQKGS